MTENSYPKLHNATWPGIVGKGPDSEPPISLEKMLEMTAAAEVDGVKFDGVDVGLFDPSINLDDQDGIKRLADQVSKHNLVIGSLVAPIWGGPAMGTKEDRANFVDQVRKSCIYGQKLKEMGVRPYGVVRIDSASSVESWAKDPVNNTKLIAAAKFGANNTTNDTTNNCASHFTKVRCHSRCANSGYQCKR